MYSASTSIAVCCFFCVPPPINSARMEVGFGSRLTDLGFFEFIFKPPPSRHIGLNLVAFR